MLGADVHKHQSELWLPTQTTDASSQPQKDIPRGKTEIFTLGAHLPVIVSQLPYMYLMIPSAALGKR